MNQEELIMDFAVRYLKGMGLTEDDFLDDAGDFKPEYVEHLSTLVKDISNDKFWQDYQLDPDATTQQVVETTKQKNEQQVTSAKRGAKLEKLKNMKKSVSTKCKCGCDMVEVKEAGGKISSKCSCNCSGGKMNKKFKVGKKETGGLIEKFQSGGGLNRELWEHPNNTIYKGSSFSSTYLPGTGDQNRMLLEKLKAQKIARESGQINNATLIPITTGARGLAQQMYKKGGVLAEALIQKKQEGKPTEKKKEWIPKKDYKKEQVKKPLLKK